MVDFIKIRKKLNKKRNDLVIELKFIQDKNYWYRQLLYSYWDEFAHLYNSTKTVKVLQGLLADGRKRLHDIELELRTIKKDIKENNKKLFEVKNNIED